MPTILNAAHNSRSSALPVVSGALEALAPQPEDLKALQQVGTKVRFTRNTTIFNEGDEANFTYKIVSGAVRLCKHTSNGRRQIADFLLAGDYFGFLQMGTYSFTAEAVSDLVVVCYPQRAVEQLSNTMPSLNRRLIGILSERLLGMQDHLVMLGRQSAKQRVAAFIIKLAERSEAEEGEIFDVPMNRQEIADYLGLTIETVCRSLSELKRSKLIEIPAAHEIVIKKANGLAAVVESDD